MEFLSIHSIALWTLMFSLSREQHLCAVTADGEKVAFLGGFLTDLTKRLRIWAAVFSKIQENFEQIEPEIAQKRCF